MSGDGMSKHEIVSRAALFQEGARRIYEGTRPPAGNGDMWLFELFHFLVAVQEKLGTELPPIMAKIRPEQAMG